MNTENFDQENDFSTSLSELDNFGIEDTQVLSSESLNSFLTADPDTVLKNTPVEKEIEETEIEKEDTEEVPTKKTVVKPPVKSEKETSKQNLEDVLFNNDDDGDENGYKEEGSTNDESNDIDYDTLSKDLLRLGAFTESDEETDVKTPEQFLERFLTEKKKGAINILDNFLSQFGEEHRKMFDSVFVKGVDPKEYLNSFVKVDDILQLDMTDKNNQEKVLRTYYNSLNWDEDKISKRLSKLADYGDLEEEATSYKDVIVNREKEKQKSIEDKKIEESKTRQESEEASYRNYQRILTEKLKDQEIDGIPLTQKDAERIYSFMVNKPYKLPSGELLSEYDKQLLDLNRPENSEAKLKLALLLDKKMDLSTVKKTNLSKKSEALFTLTAKNSKEKSRVKAPSSFF